MKRLALVVIFLLMAACSRTTPAPTGAPVEAPTDAVPISLVETATPEQPTSTPTLTATSTPTETPTVTPTATPEPKGYGPKDFPPNVNPLTGLEVEDESLLERRPVAVKINIVPRYVRPPWGLTFADIVFDYYHNDGYARFHAIYYGQEAELVGPIRSGRLLDDSLVRMYKSIFAYGSADQKINYRLFSSNYVNRLILEGARSLCPPTDKAPLCRYEPNGPDHLLGGTKEIGLYAASRGVDNTRQDLSGMTFHPVLPSGGQPGAQIVIRFSGDNYSRWDFDPNTGRYLLFQDNVFLNGSSDEQFVPLTDRLNDQQIATDNVVVVMAGHEYFQRPPADIVEIKLTGSGPGYAFRDGQMFNVTWHRPAADSVLYLTFPDGTDFPFKPGTTWFEVMGETSIVSQAASGARRFEWRMP